MWYGCVECVVYCLVVSPHCVQHLSGIGLIRAVIEPFNTVNLNPCMTLSDLVGPHHCVSSLTRIKNLEAL